MPINDGGCIESMTRGEVVEMLKKNGMTSFIDNPMWCFSLH